MFSHPVGNGGEHVASESSAFELPILCQLRTRLGASCLISLSLSLFIHEMGMTTISTSAWGCNEDRRDDPSWAALGWEWSGTINAFVLSLLCRFQEYRSVCGGRSTHTTYTEKQPEVKDYSLLPHLPGAVSARCPVCVRTILQRDDPLSRVRATAVGQRRGYEGRERWELDFCD